MNGSGLLSGRIIFTQEASDRSSDNTKIGSDDSMNPTPVGFCAYCCP